MFQINDCRNTFTKKCEESSVKFQINNHPLLKLTLIFI